MKDVLLQEFERTAVPPPPPFSVLERRARRRRRSRAFGVAGGVVAAVAVVALAVPEVIDRWSGDTHRPLATPSTATSSMDSAFAAASALGATELFNIGAKDKLFSTVTIDPSRHTLVVYRKGGKPSGIYPKHIDGIPVEFGSALLTAGETKETIDTIWQARGTLVTEGVNITSIEAGEGGGPVGVHVDNPTSTTINLVAMFAPYGRSTIQILGPENATVLPLPHFVAPSGAPSSH